MELIYYFLLLFAIGTVLYVLSKKPKIFAKTYKLTNQWLFANEDEKDFFILLERHRADYDIPLFFDRDASVFCKAHSKYMASEGHPSHDLYGSREGLLREMGATIVKEIAGNNLSPEGMFSAFLRSDRHRQAIEDERYKACGIGIYRDERNVMYCTVLFFSYEKAIVV